MAFLAPIRLTSCFSHFTLVKRISCMNYESTRSVIIRNAVYDCVWKPMSALTYRHYSCENKSNLSSQKEQSVIQKSSFTKVNQRTRLKQAVRDYGATIIVFHVVISLTSLGLCYLAISNGVDVVRILTFIGFSDSLISSKVAVGGSTFVVSYAVHKLFAPVRIGITLSVAPFIVRYLRRINWLKPPKSK